MTSELLISFPAASAADANGHAQTLRRALLEADASVKCEPRRSDERTMDFGATLVLVLGAPAVVAAAKALHSWLVRSNATEVRVQRGNTSIVLKRAESKDVAAIIAAISAIGDG
jgi:hypothetical protein